MRIGAEPQILWRKQKWKLQALWRERFLPQGGGPIAELWVELQRATGVRAGARAEGVYAELKETSFSLFFAEDELDAYDCSSSNRLPTLEELLSLVKTGVDAVYVVGMHFAWTFVVTHEHGESNGGPFFILAH